MVTISPAKKDFLSWGPGCRPNGLIKAVVAASSLEYRECDIELLSICCLNLLGRHGNSPRFPNVVWMNRTQLSVRVPYKINGGAVRHHNTLKGFKLSSCLAGSADSNGFCVVVGKQCR